MLNRIKSLLAGGAAREPARERERIQVATCVVLLELAHADQTLHPLEADLVRDLLQRRFDLPAEDVDELLEFARAERQESLDLFQFTRAINEGFGRAEKLDLMENLWRVVYADGVLDQYEDHLMRQLANLLRLSHREMIETKVKVLDRIRPDRPGRFRPE